MPECEVWAFGSRAKWTAKEYSDLDLAVICDRPLGLSTTAALAEDFSESDLPWRVDVVDWATTIEAFRKVIEPDKVVVQAGRLGVSAAGDTVTENKPLHLPSRFAALPARWAWLRLDDACDGVFDCPHSTPGLVAAGPFVVRSQDIITGVFRTEQAARVSEETYKERTSRVVPARGDLLYSREGTYFGIAAEVPEQTRVCLGQRMVLIRPKSGVVDFRFLGRWLNSPIMASHIHGYRDGTVAERLNLPTIRALPVLVPPLPEQRAIAHILGTLDDKIELNRRMNETLEAMARALFTSWFIDFDPVRAKAEGRDTGLPPHIADLFPDSFEDSELGEIPKGWEVGTLTHYVDVMRGLSYKGSGLSRAGVPMHNLNSIYEGGGYKYDGLKHYEGEYKPHHVARSADVIVANTEQGHHRLLIGYAAIVPSRFDGETLFSHHIYRVRPKTSSGLTPDFLCRLLNAKVMHDTVSGYANGTTVNMLPIDALQSPKVVVPHSRVVAVFNDIAEATRKRHEEMVEESRILAALRGTLLPKLISGDLRVEDVKRRVRVEV
ncbi:MAG: hypothetical protein EPO26_16900 [Chloroflexota bacterium]|nr:MAG: hypothetical protein EPO26_16900 [Chloroflexota bacterium]